jgi:hypothetical protein
VYWQKLYTAAILNTEPSTFEVVPSEAACCGDKKSASRKDWILVSGTSVGRSITS